MERPGSIYSFFQSVILPGNAGFWGKRNVLCFQTWFFAPLLLPWGWPLCFGFCLTPGFGVQCIAGMCVQQFQITQTMQTPGFVFNSYLSLCHGLSRGKTCSILPGKDSALCFAIWVLFPTAWLTFPPSFLCFHVPVELGMKSGVLRRTARQGRSLSNKRHKNNPPPKPNPLFPCSHTENANSTY